MIDFDETIDEATGTTKDQRRKLIDAVCDRHLGLIGIRPRLDQHQRDRLIHAIRESYKGNPSPIITGPVSGGIAENMSKSWESNRTR